MTKTRPFLSMCYGDPSATEVPPCCETATKKLTFSTTSVLLLLNMPLSLSRATIFRRQKNPRRVYRPKIAGILFVCNEPEGKYYTVPSAWDSIVVTGAILELSCSQEAFTANFYLQSVQGEFFLFAVCSHAVIIYFGGLGLALYWG